MRAEKLELREREGGIGLLSEELLKQERLLRKK